MPLISSKRMQNVNLIEGEESDNEVMVIEESLSQRIHGYQSGPDTSSLEEQQQDEQLKELGFFEEGMTREQKMEILQVIAASRKTAQQEETRRQHVKIISSIPPADPPPYHEEIQEFKSTSAQNSQDQIALEPLATDDEESRSSEGSYDETGSESPETKWFEIENSNSPTPLKRPEYNQLKEEMPYFSLAGQDPRIVAKKIELHMDAYKQTLSALQNKHEEFPWAYPRDHSNLSSKGSSHLQLELSSSLSSPNLMSGDPVTLCANNQSSNDRENSTWNQFIRNKRPSEQSEINSFKENKRFKRESINENEEIQYLSRSNSPTGARLNNSESEDF